MSAVKPKRLGDLITLKRGYDLPEKDRTLGDFPVISSAGISGYHNEYKVEGEGVVTGRYGTLGQMYFIDGKYWPHNTALYVQDFKGNDPRYIYYLLNCIGRIRTSDKSAVPGVNRNELHEMAVPSIEDTNIQISVRTLLWSIDKKIALNNKINTELESMAKLIYDYWFVQFDFPDANGKPYKSSGGKMVYNEALKREIPEGWGDSKLGDICDLYQSKTISGKEMNPEGKHLVYGANGIVGRYDSYNHEQCVVTITCRGNSCGTINSTRPFSWITGNAMVVSPKQDYISIDYLLNALYWTNVSAAITGSAQPQITRENLAPTKMLAPDPAIAIEYFNFTKINHAKRLNIQLQNDQLTELRDWLLPMLMNGQVTVKDTAS